MLNKSTAGHLAGPSALELVNYGRGWAWLRPELDAAIRDADRLDQDLTRTLGWPEPQPDPSERIALTALGRRALAMERLFGPWPTVADVVAAESAA